MEPFIGTIQLYAFSTPPDGWLICDGSTLQILNYPALFAAISTTYGGDGITTFALPNIPPLGNEAPAYYIAFAGLMPKTVMDAFIGQIQAFAFSFTPQGWLPCSGQLLQIQQYRPLYQLIGTVYGGDGQTYFGLPNLPPVGPKGPTYFICFQGDFPQS
jgi:microcystin-dependent protein